MNIWKDTNWYAVQTKPARESVAAKSIESLELRVFLPRLKCTRQIRGVTRTITEPLFPGYLFARFCPSVFLHLIRYSQGITRVVSGGGIPIPVEDEIVQSIQSRTDAEGCVELKPTPWLPGDCVTVETGPFGGMSGIFEREIKGSQRVVILLEAISHARVLLERHCLRGDLQLC